MGPRADAHAGRIAPLGRLVNLRDPRVTDPYYKARVRARGMVALYVGAAIVTVTARARAQVPRVRLSVVAPPEITECVTDAQLRGDVGARLQHDPFDPMALRAIEVVLAQTSTGLSARVYVRDDPSAAAAMREITVDAGECERLRGALGLVVALAIDPASLVLASSPEPSPSPPPPSAPRALRLPTASDPAPWDAREHVWLGVGTSWGTLPDFAPALALGMDTARHGLLFAQFAALRTTEARTADAAYGFSLTDFRGSTCIGSSIDRWSFSGCLGLRAGLVSGVVHNLAVMPRDPGDYPWVAVAGSARVGLAIVNGLALDLTAEPYAALLRQSFRMTSAGGGRAVFEQQLVGVFVQASVRVRFW